MKGMFQDDNGWGGGGGGGGGGGKKKWKEDNSWKDDNYQRDSTAERQSLWSEIVVEGDGEIVSQGYSPEGGAILYEKANDVFQSAHWILSELIEEVKEDVEFTDDPEHDKFPEVDQAIKNAGFEQGCYCVAMCPKFMKYGVGLAQGWKDREKAAKLALALTIASGTGELGKLCNAYEEVKYFCAAEGIHSTGTGRRWRPDGSTE